MQIKSNGFACIDYSMFMQSLNECRTVYYGLIEAYSSNNKLFQLKIHDGDIIEID